MAITMYPVGSEITLLMDSIPVGRVIQSYAEARAEGAKFRKIRGTCGDRWLSDVDADRLFYLVQQWQVTVRWAKGHGANEMNILADRYARVASRAGREIWTVDQAATYCGIDPPTFRAFQRSAGAPKFIPGTSDKLDAPKVRTWHTRMIARLDVG